MGRGSSLQRLLAYLTRNALGGQRRASLPHPALANRIVEGAVEARTWKGLRAIASVHTIVTSGAQGDQILLGIVPGLAAKFLVMDLQIIRTGAGLTFPSIPQQDLCTKLLVGDSGSSRKWACFGRVEFMRLGRSPAPPHFPIYCLNSGDSCPP